MASYIPHSLYRHLHPQAYHHALVENINIHYDVGEGDLMVVVLLDTVALLSISDTSIEYIE